MSAITLVSYRIARLLPGLSLVAACSLFNRAGPLTTCGELMNGEINACADGIIATCESGFIYYHVCSDSGACGQSWQRQGAYICSQTDPPFTPVLPENPGSVCTPGARQCSGTVPQICNAQGTAWTSQATCPYACSSGDCTGSGPGSGPGSGSGATICTPGSKQCSGNVSETCNADGTAWGNRVKCRFPSTCSNGDCSGMMCTPGTKQCSGKVAETCNAQGTAWADQTTCPDTCSAGTCTGSTVCTPACSGTTPSCVNGACAANVSCAPGGPG